MTPEDHVVSDRGGVIENRHIVHAAVVDSTGRVLYAIGNPLRITLARSAAKPAQALAVLETGAFEQFGLDEADLALACASHSSEDRHLHRVFDMLAKAGATEADLRCGGHPALSEAANRKWIKMDYAPTAVTNNCSGKHAAMLAGARSLGAGVEDYHLPTHPVQQRVKKTVEELCGLDEDGVGWSIDGCNLPAPAFPLRYLARVYASFAAAADTDTDEPRPRAMARVFNAMSKYPELVGGEDRFCTLLMQTFQGQLIGKIGADACYGVGVRESEQTRLLGADGAIGISVKIEDGNPAALYAAVVEILEQLQIGTEDMRGKLDKFHHPVRLNTAGAVVGRVSCSFQLHSCN